MRWLALTFIVFLSACSSSPSPIQPPLELQEFDRAVDVYTVWTTEVGTGAYDHYLKFAPVFLGNIGYIADYRGMLRAFDVNTGDTLWQIKMDPAVSAGPALAEGHLLVGTHTGQVIALDPKNGREIWHSQVSSEVLTDPVGAQGLIIARTVDGNLFALNAETGEQRWVYERTVPLLTLRGSSRPVIVNDIVLFGSDSGKLAALTLKEGIELWEVAISVPSGRTELERIIDIDADPVVWDDLVYVVTYQGRLAAVQIENGRMLWVRDMSSYTGMAVDEYRLYITDAQSQVLAMNRMSGATLWRQDKLLRRSLTAPVIQGDYLAVGDYDGYVHWLNRDDGRISGRSDLYVGNSVFDKPDDVIYYEDRKRNILADPVVYQDKLFATDRFGVLSAFKLSKE